MSERRRRPGTLLVVDLGNTRTTVACFAGPALAGRWAISTRRRTTDEVALVVGPMLAELEAPRPRTAVLCSVVPPLDAAWCAGLERLTGAAPIVAGVAAAHGLRIVYREPERLGPDRIANAIGVCDRHGAPAIVVDLGTATNFDCVSAEGAFIGGAIAPGVGIGAAALFRRGARLPRIALERPARVLGQSTEEALRAGIVGGAAAMVDGMVRRLTREMGGRPRVVATGGWARVMAAECETVDVVDEDLTLHGLRIMGQPRT